MSSKNKLIVLHLSDLHFGWDGDEKAYADRDLALKGLLNVLSTLESDWKPNFVCISGDIGWRGQQNDYKLAKSWINELLTNLKVSPDALFICPGNHDVNRSVAKRNARPGTTEEADEVLATPISEHLQSPFQALADFCKDTQIPSLLLGETETYLVGQRSFREVNFVSYNSAWFSKGDDDKGKLWIGLPQIKFMESKGQLPQPKQLNEWPVTIALLHHPKEWFHEAENQAVGNRPNTFDCLSRRCHLLLTGHTHGEVRSADMFAEGTWHLSGGAAYTGASHFNSFRIIRVESDCFVYRSFEYDPRSSDNLWRHIGEAHSLNFRPKAEKSLIKVNSEQAFDLSMYRKKALADAQRLIETKSRALKPFGKLPKTLPLNVSVHVKGPRHRFTPEGELALDPKMHVPMPLFIAARQSRRTLLLGDLGSGKSTLAGMFVIQTLQESKESVACIIPAKRLNLSYPLTVKGLIRAASEYFNEQISPNTPAIDLEGLLNQRVEVSIVIDGLDEVSVPQATELLTQLGALVEHWPNIQVMATGRPIELVGISYEEWEVLSTLSLNDDERLRLLEEEAIIDLKTEGEAKELASQLLNKLKTFPILNSLATTPLVIRLLYSRLTIIKEDSTFTLGDLLYELLKERLGGWAVKDTKQSSTLEFESEFPDEDSRAELLGRLALHLEMHKSVQLEEARLRLQSLVKRSGGPNERTLANEALEFFIKSGLILKVDNELQFPVQPLFEFLSGYGLVTLWQNASRVATWLKPQHWRVISFAATILRRLGLIEALRSRLLDFLKELLSDEWSVPAASYIVSESQDKICAEFFIANLNNLGPRPLTLFREELDQSARAIAESIKLAGQVGFDWFFDHYLNPRYPIINAGSGVISHVFREWTYISVDKIKDHEKERLSTMIMPHTQAGTHELITIFPLLAMLIPHKFELRDKLWFCGKFLGNEQLSVRVTQHFEEAYESGHSAVVNNVLISLAHNNAAPAAWLWMKLNDGKPPSYIIKAIIKARGSYYPNPSLDEYIEHCIQRIGQEPWEAFLRWCLFSSDYNLAAGAAIELYRRGERRLSLLGEPLLKALHDGGYVRRAEEILSSIIHDGGSDAVKWLSRHIAAMERDIHGSHSGWWRIFLSELPNLGDEGPQLLAKSIGGVGCFLLPRYPEVRQMFRNLLIGHYGTDYHNALQERLYDLNPAIRHGAAMILVVCDPKNESKALEVVVKSKSREHYGSWHEWEHFCLSLSFGSSVLAYLESKLQTFDSSAEIFALAILYRNGIKLDEKYRERFIEGLLSHWLLEPEDRELSVLANPESFEYLIKVVEGEPNENASRAANKLLQYHAQKLSQVQQARCVNLTITGGLWRLMRLDEQIKRIKEDSSYSEAIEHSAIEIVAQGGEKPLLGMVREALINEEAWEDVVWRLICNDSGFKLDYEDNGQWLLDYGRAVPEHGKIIGRAAIKSLDDPRVQASRWTEMRHWLALLGDEFVGLSKEQLESILSRGQVIHTSATSGLIARLGYVPAGFKKRDTVGAVPPLSAPPAILSLIPSDQFNKLRELARQSESLHPDVCSTIEALVFELSPSNDDIKVISNQGIHGVLISSVLSFIYGWSPNTEFILKLLSLRLTRTQADDHCFQRLTRIWRDGHLKAIKEDPSTKANYIEVLNGALTSGTGDVLAIAAELITLRGNLLTSQITHVFDYYTKNPLYHDYGLGNQLVKWLSEVLDHETSTTLTEAIERGLTTLDGQPWDFKEGLQRDAFRFLLIPLAYWKITGEVSDLSIRVFLRGIKYTFSKQIGPYKSDKPVEIIGKLEPLLSKIPKSLLDSVLTHGLTFDDPVIRGICRLFIIK